MSFREFCVKTKYVLLFFCLKICAAQFCVFLCFPCAIFLTQRRKASQSLRGLRVKGSHGIHGTTQNAVRSGIVSRRRRRLSQNNMRSNVSVVFRDFRVDLHQRISVPSLWRVPRRWSGRFRCGCQSRSGRRWWHIPFGGRTWRCHNSRR